MNLGTEKLAIDAILAPTTSTDVFGQVFTVGERSIVCRLTTPTGEDMGVPDAFELHNVLDFVKATGVPTRTYAIKEKNLETGTSFGLFLGSDNHQEEVVIRGLYVWKKILGTTPLVGVERLQGFEEVK